MVAERQAEKGKPVRGEGRNGGRPWRWGREQGPSGSTAALSSFLSLECLS